MRIVGPLSHPKFKVVLYALEQHWYVEIETGPMKQCFKIPKARASSQAEVQKWLDQEFSEEAYRIFEAMYKNYKASADRNLEEPK
jgi:hypothetical protein